MTCDTPTENEIFGEITVDNKSTTSMFLDAINETSPVLDFTVSEDIGTSVPYQIEHNRGEQTDGLDLLRYRVVDKFEHEGYTCFIIIHNTDPECWQPTINDQMKCSLFAVPCENWTRSDKSGYVSEDDEILTECFGGFAIQRPLEIAYEFLGGQHKWNSDGLHEMLPTTTPERWKRDQDMTGWYVPDNFRRIAFDFPWRDEFGDDFGGGRPTRLEQLYAWTSKYKLQKFRMSGEAMKPLKFVSISLGYLAGSPRS